MLAYKRKNKSLRIIGIAVTPSMQNQGIGRLLLNRAKLDALKFGFKGITTRSQTGCEFYLKNGFVITDYYNNGDYLLTFNLKLE